MKISLNTVKEYTNVNWSVDELVDKLSTRLGGVEGFTDLSKLYDQAYVVKVVAASKHPNADKLTVCLVDDAGVVDGVERNNDGYVQVVCGAPNVTEGMLAVWLPPGAVVPSSVASGDPFKLASRSLRGVVSRGMLASLAEMNLGDDHSGIIDITAEQVELGASFVEVYGLDDVMIDVENKMFTHRPDCFGQIGIAREVAGIQHLPFESPEWYVKEPIFTESDRLNLKIDNQAGAKVPRFVGLALDGVKIGPSPMWLKVFLAKMGVSSINNVVDITNYVMHVTAQPLHAYDYDRVGGATLVSRFANEGEKIALLNQKTYALSQDDIVIADATGAIGVAGIMGGSETEVSHSTERVIVEAATFDMYAVRKTSMRHGLFTDALTRFNKGQSPNQASRAMWLAVDLLIKYAGASVASKVYDVDSRTEVSESSGPVLVSSEFINTRLGLSLSTDEMAELLGNVEFDVEVQGSTLAITPPYWRMDIKIKEDIVEEVGRIYGFDRLNRELPVSPTVSASKSANSRLKDVLRGALSGIGGNEVLTYSFVNEKVLRSVNQPVERAYRLSNALSPDLQAYRMTVLPSLLDKVYANVKAGYDSFMLYEFGKGHDKSLKLVDGLPVEPQYLDLVYVSTKPQPGAAFYVGRGVVDYLASRLKLDLVVESVDTGDDSIVLGPFHAKRRAVVSTADGQKVGYIGEVKPSVRKAFKLPEYTAVLSLDFEALSQVYVATGSVYQPLSRYPSVYRDVSLKTNLEVSASEIEASVKSAIKVTSLDGVKVNYEITSVFKPTEGETKNTTLHFTITPYEGTLKGEQVNSLMDSVTDLVCQELSAEVV